MDRPFSRPDAQQPDYSRRRSKASWIFEKLLFTDLNSKRNPSGIREKMETAVSEIIKEKEDKTA